MKIGYLNLYNNMIMLVLRFRIKSLMMIAISFSKVIKNDNYFNYTNLIDYSYI